VVTGKKNSPTAAHAGCKRRPKWVPGAWGYGWVTLPGITDMVDWSSLLGIGYSLTACHHKKAKVGNLNCGLGTFRVESTYAVEKD